METIGQLIEKLNAVVSSAEFVKRLEKVHGHSEFHDLVREFVKPMLPPELSITTWHLSIPHSDLNIAAYSRDFIPYKNSTRNDRGKFSNVSFYLPETLRRDLTLEQAYTALKRVYVENRIAEFKKAISHHEKEIAEYKKHISDYEKELESLS